MNGVPLPIKEEDLDLIMGKDKYKNELNSYNVKSLKELIKSPANKLTK